MTEATIDQSAKDSWEKVLNKIIEDSDMVMLSSGPDAAPESDAVLMEQARGMLHQFALRTVEGKILSHEKKGLLKALGDAIARIDAELGHRLGQLRRSDDFQKLERSWRGLHGLVKASETGPRLKRRLLNAGKSESGDVLSTAVDGDQSQVWKRMSVDEEP